MSTSPRPHDKLAEGPPVSRALSAPPRLVFREYQEASLAVHRFTGKEGISKLFKFDVEFEVREPASAVAARLAHDAASQPNDVGDPNDVDGRVVGRPAIFTFGDDAASLRSVHGVVSRVRRVERTGANGPVFAVRLVPHLAMRRHELASRVFQHLSVPEIVAELLTKVPHGGYVQELETELVGTYTPREYVVQYRETDYDFVKRILAEEGIYWYFRRETDPTPPGGTSTRADPVHSDPLDVMVLADGAGYAAIQSPAPRLERPSRDNRSRARLDAFEPAGRTSPQSVLLREYDFERPARSMEAFAKRPSARVDRVDAVGPGDPHVDSPRVYEHESDGLVPEATFERAARRLEQHQRGVYRARGRSGARHLMPGYRFQASALEPTVGDAPEEFVATRVEHRGVTPEFGGGDESYSNEFEAVPAVVPFRPKRPERRIAQVLESAVVTGRDDGSVYADEFGRIRVQFHWDLDGPMNEHSTAWLRVMQGWSGAAFGLQFIPRVGMEVMVSFLGGDPNCPVVLGAVYNRTHPLPFAAGASPDGSALGSNLRSGIRTASYPGGNGFNELSFEDLAGNEQVYLHAQRDFDAVVRRNQSLSVERCQHVEIGESQTCHVKDRRAERIDGSAERCVGGDERDEIKGGRATTVDGSDVLAVGKERRVRVGVDDRLEVEGRQSSWVKGDRFIRTNGNAVVVVGSADAPRGCAARIEGTADISASRLIDLSSETGIRLRCGQSVIEIMPSSIDILSPAVRVRSANAEIETKEGQVSVYAKSQVTASSGQRIELASELGGRLALDAGYAAEGERVSFDRPAPKAATTEDGEEPVTTIVLKDAGGQPLPTRRFVLVLEGGAERSFVTDERGECEVRGLSGEAHIHVPDLVGLSQGGGL
ncbi:MAG: type VI secretion system tip protein TssI/VgrG [Polyangiaceae bacterium]